MAATKGFILRINALNQGTSLITQHSCWFCKTFSVWNYCQVSLKFFYIVIENILVTSKDTNRGLEMAASSIEKGPWRMVTDSQYPFAEILSAAVSSFDVHVPQ
jgi:hypothetical protein